MMNEQITSQLEAMRKQECGAYACRNYFRQQPSDATKCKFGKPASPSEKWSKKSQRSASVSPSSRTKMVDWCFQIVDHCGFDRESVIIAMSYLDRFLMTESGAFALQDKNTFQLASMTSLYMAIKLFEPEVIDPAIVSKLSRGVYTENDITEMEMVILSALEWRVQPPTALDFIRHFLALVDINEMAKELVIDVSRVQVENALSDISLIEVKPSTIAAASILNTIDLMDRQTLPDGSRCSVTHALKLHGSVSIIFGREMRKIRDMLLDTVRDEDNTNTPRNSCMEASPSGPESKPVQETVATSSPQSVERGPNTFMGTFVSSFTNVMHASNQAWS